MSDRPAYMIPRADVDLIYPVPIYVGKFLDTPEMQNEIAGVIDKLNFNHGIANWIIQSPNSMKYSNLCGDIIKDHNMMVFEKFIHANLMNYCNQIGFRPPNEYVRESWIARSNPGEYMSFHDHAFRDISCVYYYQSDGKDGSLILKNPNTLAATSLCYQKYGGMYGEMYGGGFKYYRPEVGQLILFPGFMEHAVSINESDNVRISVVVNYTFNRK